MRAVGAAVLSGLGVLLVFSVWLRYPIHLSIAIGAVFVVMFLMVAASIGDDPVEADAAWRAAAPDLAGHRGGRGRNGDDDPDAAPVSEVAHRNGR